MRVAFLGNNLNAGFTFVRGLRALGVDAELFYIPSGYGQDRPEWWSTADDGPPLSDGWVHVLHDFDLEAGEPFVSLADAAPLASRPPVRRLYDALRTHDVVVAAENGPALLSEFAAAPKVFLSFGFDLQVLPFYTSVYCLPAVTGILRSYWHRLRSGERSPRMLIRATVQAGRELRDCLHGLVRPYARMQARQRRGIRQCAAVLCAPYQRSLAKRIGVRQGRIAHLPLLPMDPSQLAEVDAALVRELEQRYGDVDLVFFHPTRQFYLRENGNRFLKDNDKLLRAFARHACATRRRVKLVLVEKGPHVEHARQLIRDADLEGFVDWIPELPNHRLRAFYRLPNVVVCDQFNPSLASLGNIGREATFFGRPLVTAFGTPNELVYPGDPPPHVYPAETESQVLSALDRVSGLSQTDRKTMGTAATAWFHRHFDTATAMPRYLDLLYAVRDGRWRN